MDALDFKKIGKKLPDKPGVYLFRDKKKKILYIGKATSLRDRVRSYFPSTSLRTSGSTLLESRGPLLVDMITKAKKVDFMETDSVLEALILEANLIKKYQPKYNTKEKDNKSFNYVVITKEDFPRIFTLRGRELRGLSLAAKPRRSRANVAKHGGTVPTKLQTIYGPYPQGGILKEALNIIRKIFPFRDKRADVKGNETFYRQIGLAPDTVNEASSSAKAMADKKKEYKSPSSHIFTSLEQRVQPVADHLLLAREYQKTIRNIKLFFEGKKRTLIRKLEKEMGALAKNQSFEKADEIKRQLFALKHIQDVALIREDPHTNILQNVGMRVEAYDVAHISGKSMVGVMTVIEDGEIQKGEYRKFKIRKYEMSNDTGALKEVLERRFGHSEWMGPALVIIDGGKAQKNAAERVLKNLDLPIPVVAVVKDEYHRPKNILGDKKLIRKFEKEILLANSEAHRFVLSFHRNLQRRSMKR